MLYLKNLSSTAICSGVAPWDWTPEQPFPEETRTNKKARDAWASNPATDTNIYTGYEGLSSTTRIRQSGEDSNPPVKEHFIVADFDSPVPQAMALQAVNSFDPKPNRLERTLSGNWRAVWFLESPVIIPSYEWAKAFKKEFHKFAFNPEKMLPGFDRGAWEAPERFWTNSGEWFTIHDEKIPAERILGWSFLASQKFNFKKSFNSIAIPPEVLAPELAKRYTKFASWPGEFCLGSQGPTFWVENSASPKSAIVRETGMQTFSDHAGKGFFTWAELVGAEFTKNYEADAIGRAVEGIHYDGRNYWINEDGIWRPRSATDARLALRIDRSVSGVPGKDGNSDADKALRHIQRYSTVTGAAPFVCRRPGMVKINGDLFLNTLTTPFMAPAPGAQVWGQTGNFPFTSAFLEHLFVSRVQLESFLSWASHFYRCGVDFTPRAGLIVVLAGSAGVGKTFLVYGILGKIVGGVGEASNFLSGNDNFGSENFGKAVWAVDDAKTATDYASHKKFSEGIKRAAANDAAVYHVKYQVPVIISWFGRIILCLNKDAESLRLIPDLDISIRDKISLYKVTDTPFAFLPRKEQEEIIDRELAFFCAYLRDYVIPAEHVGSERFGVEPHHDAEIFERAQQSGPAAAFNELLDVFKTYYFEGKNPQADEWVGSAMELYRIVNEDPSMLPIAREFTVSGAVRRLHTLSNTEGSGVTASPARGGVCLFRIERPSHLTKKQNNKK